MREKKNTYFHMTPSAIGLLLLAFGVNCFSYRLGRILAQDMPHISMMTELDRSIPFVPAMIIIYWGCFLFWGIDYALIICKDHKKGVRFVTAHVMGELVCFLFFILMPTTMTRAHIVGSSPMELMMKLLYTIDSADNLFPSIHCFVSWLCWIGVRRDKNFSRCYRLFALLMAIAVCLSTLLVKQHVIADVAAGILLAEISYSASGAAQGDGSSATH